MTCPSWCEARRWGGKSLDGMGRATEGGSVTGTVVRVCDTGSDEQWKRSPRSGCHTSITRGLQEQGKGESSDLRGGPRGRRAKKKSPVRWLKCESGRRAHLSTSFILPSCSSLPETGSLWVPPIVHQPTLGDLYGTEPGLPHDHSLPGTFK